MYAPEDIKSFVSLFTTCCVCSERISKSFVTKLFENCCNFLLKNYNKILNYDTPMDMLGPWRLYHT